MKNRKLYDVLGVAPSADDKALKKAYRKLARKHHPDHNPGDPDSERRFKELGSAWEVLGDPEKRKLYDEYGEASTQPGFDPNRGRGWQTAQDFGGGLDFEDLFGDLFAGRSRRGPQRRSPTDTRADLAVDFSTAILGGERQLTFQDGGTLSVRIPPGVRDRETLRIRGKGGGGGDLLLTLHIEADPVFRRKGEDLHIDVPVTIGEALGGATIEIPTPENTVRLRIPAGTQSGRTLRLRGKGVTRRGRPGDLYAHIEVRIPESVDAAALKDAIDAIEGAYRGNVRSGLLRGKLAKQAA